MATYKVTSDNTSLGKMGDVVNNDDLAGLNVEALISGGHIAEVKTNKADTPTSKDEK